jgi:rhodanese-related sulfurtransferase
MNIYKQVILISLLVFFNNKKVGDSTESLNYITGKLDRFALAGPAAKQGRIAGYNSVCGSDRQFLKFVGSLGTSILECCGNAFAITGLTEKACKALKIEYNVNTLHLSNHVSWFPGATTMSIKVLSRKENDEIIGAQIIGKEGVDKRIDVFATAIYAKMNYNNLENLDLAYSPQYGSSKDPIVMTGFSLQNMNCQDVKTISVLDFLKHDKKNTQIIDVRTKKEFDEGSFENSININVDELRKNLNLIDKEKNIVVYCKAGFRGYLASRILSQNGFNVQNLSGGWQSLDALINSNSKL